MRAGRKLIPSTCIELSDHCRLEPVIASSTPAPPSPDGASAKAVSFRCPSLSAPTVLLSHYHHPPHSRAQVPLYSRGITQPALLQIRLEKIYALDSCVHPLTNPQTDCHDSAAPSNALWDMMVMMLDCFHWPGRMSSRRSTERARI